MIIHGINDEIWLENLDNNYKYIINKKIFKIKTKKVNNRNKNIKKLYLIK